MRLKKVKIENFRSFGEEQEIDITNNTVLIGNNSSGKTTVLQAISKLFSNKQSDRIIRRSDFHLPRGEEPGKNRKELHIETRFEFDELDNNGNSISIPKFFQNLTVEGVNGRPFLRIRLESKYEDDGTSEGSIETNFFYITSPDEDFSDNSKKVASRLELDKIRLLYVPALRHADKELAYSSGSMLSRLVNSINWKKEDVEDILSKIEDLNNTLLSDTGTLKLIDDAIQDSWKKFYKEERYSNTALTFNNNDIKDLLKKLELLFSPTVTEDKFKVTDLGDGLNSLFYFSLVDTVLDIEAEILMDRGENQVEQKFKLFPPVLTIVAIEEPENHIAPHHIGKLVKRFSAIADNTNSQVLMSSHSPAIIKRIDPEDLRHLRINEKGSSLVKKINLPENTGEQYKYIKGAIQAYPELYFAKLVVLGEGDSEELLLPKFFELFGNEIDSSQISVVPLGGRHVNYFWKLLSELDIPYITLLDLDNERYGGGWGRIKYVFEKLHLVKEDFCNNYQECIKTINAHIKNPYDKKSEELLNVYINFLETHNVYFSEPLDIDFLMLKNYKSFYIDTLSSNEGPVITYEDCNNENKKVKLLDYNPDDNFQSNGYSKRVKIAIKATLKDKGGSGDFYTDDEKELMIRYQYLFLGRSKPTSHMNFLFNISDQELKDNAPDVFKKIVRRAEDILYKGDSDS